MKTSRRCGAHDETVGADARPPPSGCHPLQLVPSNHLCQSALSWPRAITSMRFGPHDIAEGSAVMMPPSGSQPLQVVPSKTWCQSWLSWPRMKTSVRVVPVVTDVDAVGPPVKMPPSGCHGAANLTESTLQSSGALPSYPSAHMPVPRRLLALTRSYLMPSEVASS